MIISRPIPFEVTGGTAQCSVKSMASGFGTDACWPSRLMAAEVPKITFLRDVAPILNKVGCTSGPCHGAAKGKNGFKLSLRGYDPQFDYEALLYDLSGRRFNRADPGAQPDARQADAAGGARRRAAFRNRLRLLQDHLQLDRAGRSVRRSGGGRGDAGWKSSPKRFS